MLIMKLFEHKIREWYNNSWWVKKITRTINDVIVKEFHNHIIPWEFHTQKRRIWKMKEILWEYMPETRLVGNESSYKIIQQKINWEVLWMIDKSTLSIDTLQHISNLIEKYKHYVTIENESFDIIGTTAINFNNLYIRKLSKLINLESFRASTNIIIEKETWKPYRVDVINWESVHHHSLQSKIKRNISYLFITIIYQYQKYKLDNLLKKHNTNNSL